MSYKYKHFIKGESGRIDDFICTHPLAKEVKLISNLESYGSDKKRLPLYEVSLVFKGDKPMKFGGQSIGSALEFADRYIKNVFPFDKFIICFDGKTIEIDSNTMPLQIVACAGEKSVSHLVSGAEFLSLISQTTYNIATTVPFGDIEPLLELFINKLSKNDP